MARIAGSSRQAYSSTIFLVEMTVWHSQWFVLKHNGSIVCEVFENPGRDAIGDALASNASASAGDAPPHVCRIGHFQDGSSIVN